MSFTSFTVATLDWEITYSRVAIPSRPSRILVLLLLPYRYSCTGTALPVDLASLTNLDIWHQSFSVLYILVTSLAAAGTVLYSAIVAYSDFYPFYRLSCICSKVTNKATNFKLPFPISLHTVHRVRHIEKKICTARSKER